jgi:hypothetical protein
MKVILNESEVKGAIVDWMNEKAMDVNEKDIQFVFSELDSRTAVNAEINIPD